MLIVRPGRADDAPAIIKFWNPLIRDSAVTFASKPKTTPGVANMICACAETGRAFLVAQTASHVVGFATYAQFRAGDGYARTMEHTVILAPRARGQGAARALLAALETHARNGGVKSFIAGISGENAEGIGFHDAMGYHPVGVVRDAGRKFDRWMDLHLMQKFL